MRHAVTIAALVLTVFVSACATGAREQQFTMADQEAIRKSSSEFAAAFNAKEIDKVLGFYSENSVFMPPNAPLLRGREPLKSFYTNMIEKGATNLTLEPSDVTGFGPIAYESGTYSISFDKGGRDRGKYLIVLRNTAGTWRTEKTIWSSDLPPVNQPAD
jgi:ketosteroid isomerase-like protein